MTTLCRFYPSLHHSWLRTHIMSTRSHTIILAGRTSWIPGQQLAPSQSNIHSSLLDYCVLLANLLMASTSNYEHRGRHRRHSRHTWTDSSALDVEIESSVACIDLTIDVFSDEIIDLTSGHSLTTADYPVEGSSTASDIGPMRTRRRTGRRSRLKTNSRRRFVVPVGHPSSSVVSSSHVQLLSDDSDSDSLPELPFKIPPPSVADIERAHKSSSEGVKIKCPVCLDDTKEIRGSGRQVMSTNCGHIFCDVCIKQAITIQHTCPTCRKKITRRSVHPIFL